MGEAVGQEEPTKKPEPVEEKLSENHYEALGISQKATVTEIKKAYHFQSRKFHPDKNPDNPFATKMFQRIVEAYQLLLNSTQRAQYDATLIVQQACGNVGVAADPRAAMFVARHSMPGREVSAVPVDRQHVQHVMGRNGMHLNMLKQQSGADMLLVQTQTSANAQILLAGYAASVAQARSLIQACIDESAGARAPRDGVVLIVPKASVSRIPQAAAQFQGVFMQTGAAARIVPAGDRIVVQGGPRVPQAVAQIQWSLEWRLGVLVPSGLELDAWGYAHMCEAAGAAASPVPVGDAYKFLLPQSEPEATSVRKLMCLLLECKEEAVEKESVVELTVRALEMFRINGRKATAAVARAASSVAVHAEYAALELQRAAPLLLALNILVPVVGASISPRFAGDKAFQTLGALLPALAEPREGLSLRARASMAIKDLVPEDGAWHAWEELLPPKKSDGPLVAFWDEVRSWAESRKSCPSPPIEWLSSKSMMAAVLRLCVSAGVTVDVKHGVHRAVAKKATETDFAKAEGDDAIAGKDDSKDEEKDDLTFVEQVEEVLLELVGTDAAASASIEKLAAEMVKRVIYASEVVTKEWFELQKTSFELCRDEAISIDGDEDGAGNTGDELSRVRFVVAARARAVSRRCERQMEARLVRELKVAEELLPTIMKEGPSRSLRAHELAALICIVSRGKQRLPEDLPSTLLRRLCRRGDAAPKEVLHDVGPIAPALIMRAIVALEKQRHERWDKDSLDIVLQAAALDMHAVDNRPRAALPTAAAALWAAARRPFDDRLDASRCLLVPSAALRIQVELAEQMSLTHRGSTFRSFAQMCAWLAHVVVTASLKEEVKAEALQAFRKLAAACVELGEHAATSPCDPEGLCRLAMSIALVTREENDHGGVASEGAVAGANALAGLARVCVERAFVGKEAFKWKPQQIAVLASAYAAADCANEGLFKRLGEVGEQDMMLGNEWNSEQLLKLLHSASQIEMLGHFGGLLRNLQSDQGLQKYVKEASPRDLPLLVSVLQLLQDKPLLEELARTHHDKVRGLNLQGLVALIKNWPSESAAAAKSPALAAFKAAAVRESAVLVARKAPSPAELKVLVAAAAEDAKSSDRLWELAASPAVVAAINKTASSPWAAVGAAVQGFLSPFSQHSAEIPRLEAACAARLLALLERAPAEVRDASSALLAFRDDALVAMPAFIAAIAQRFAGASLPSAEEEGAPELAEFLDRLVRAASQTADKAPDRSQGADIELDGWVDRLDRCAIEEGRSGGGERTLEWLEKQSVKRLPSSARDALGSNWLSLLLVRSRQVTWDGGKTVLLEPPRPRAAARKLADEPASGELLDAAGCRDEAEALVPEPVFAKQAAAKPPATKPQASAEPTSQLSSAPSRGAATGRGPTGSSLAIAQVASSRGGSLVGTSAPYGAASSRSAERPSPYGSRPDGRGRESPPGRRRDVFGQEPSPDRRRDSYDRRESPAPAHANERPPASRPGPVPGTGPGQRPGPGPAPSAGPSASVTRPTAGPRPGSLVVTGGWDEGMARTIAGTYVPSSTNHGRGVYRRVEPPDDSKVLLYYWDDRDGEDNLGWWFGPEVGGEEVWAQNPGVSGTALPPRDNWVILHSGEVDPGITVTKVEMPRAATPGAPSQARSTGPMPSARAPPGPSARQDRVQPAPSGAAGRAPAPVPGREPAATPAGRVPAADLGRVPAPASARGPAPMPTSSSRGGPAPRGSAARPSANPAPIGAAVGARAAAPPPGQWQSGGREGGPNGGYAGEGGYGSQGGKRARYGYGEERTSALRAWLEGLDAGVGAMLQYFDVLDTEFGADMARIASMCIGSREDGDVICAVDPAFWLVVRPARAGHRLLFAQGLLRL